MPINLEKISEYCRLCQLNPGITTFIDNEEFISQVYECTRIKINDNEANVFPKTVCSSCKLSIEKFFLFIENVKSVDKQLHDYFLLDCKEKKRLQCNECLINFSNDTLLNEHLRIHRENKRFQCPGCPKTYARYVNLQLHKRGHPTLYCFNCELTFDDTLTRKKHTCHSFKPDDVKEYNDGGIQINKIKTEPSDSDLEVKTKKKDPTKEWFEDEFPIKQENDLQQKIEDNLVCSDVGTSEIKKLNKSKANYVCSLCSKKFSWRTDFRIHQKTHTETFSCTYGSCGKVCTSAYTLRTHLMKHEGKLAFLCVTCGKGFTTKNSLTCHEKIHAKVKAYNCKECSIGFSVASNLRAHQKKHHEGIRFYCSQCTRAFITKCSLERHELVHTGIKEFKCESCPAAFYTNKELLKHQRYHQGLRLYKCDRCYKTFFEKHHLTIHIRVHTGERPYVCKVSGCGKSFTESQKLSRHVKARHPSI